MLSKKFCRLLWKGQPYRSIRENHRADQLFFEPKVQEILQKLATPVLSECFPVRKTRERLQPPEYKFMTDAEVEETFRDARERAKKWLQMPPVMDVKTEREQVICEDPALDGFDPDGSAVVFTDITYGMKDENRLIVVREPDGTLKYANRDQQHRMIETYFPRAGREHTAPPMFDGEHLESLLERREYKFILDRACVQYEPNDPEYIRVTSLTYTRVAQKMDLQLLYGTRHYGSMLFYLVFHSQVDQLLLHNLQNDRLDDVIAIVHLYHMVHSDSALSASGAEGVDLVRAFINQNVARRNILELALQTCLERQQQRKQQNQTLEEVHGLHV